MENASTAFAPKKIIIPGIIGNILEWYDFLLYAFFAPIIAQLFFPHEDVTLSLLMTFGTFAIGFFMRPLGAIIFGHFGDRFGRKVTLVTTVSLMAIATAIIGLLPTYTQIGLYAGIALILCRMLQGLAVGGEFGYVVYLIEHAPANKRGLYGSFTLFSAFAGTLLASAAATITTNLSSQATVAQWSWRIPFIFGLALGAIGLYFRLRMPETPLFSTLQQLGETVTSPLRHAFKKAPLAILKAIGLVFLPSISVYVYLVFLPSYLTTYIHIPLNTALTINTLGMLLVLGAMPVIGHLTDKFGRKPLIFTAATAVLILAYPLFILLQNASIAVVFLVQVVSALLVCLVHTPLQVTLIELVPTNIRYTAMAFPYNIANAVFGGTAPMIVTFLIQQTHNIAAPALYLMLGSVVMILITFRMKETYKEPLV
jgi:MFS transporter, MHS family, proline/betaine transporter